VPGGRPSEGKRQRYPELEELAAWFHQALSDAGYESVLEFLRNGLFEKNAVYGVFGATRLLTLESTQSLAVALKRSPTEVKAVWIHAREARDRSAMAAEKNSHPRIESWADLPLPSLALQNLLEAQVVALERLPYSLLGVGDPGLSTIYVRQQVRVLADDERGERAPTTAPGEPSTAQRPTTGGAPPALTIWDALERNDHLVITGEPGAGKSTLGNHLVRTLSEVWLREANSAEVPLSVPVVPIRVAARYLDGDGSWSTLLAQAVGRSLGRSLLQEPDAGLFAGRVQGSRWLVVVDGLDEIPDPQARAEVIRSVSQHARIRSDYRFVLTTRSLPESELAPLRSTDLGRYVVRPFGRAELEEFAHKWFAAQSSNPDSESPQAAADRFIRETSDGRLSELVQNPLLATIAAVSAVKEPTRSLPTSRVTLYERFCGYLVTEQGGRRELVPQLRRRHQDDPARLGCLLWLHQKQSAILAAVARERLEGEGTPWQTAIDWVTDNKSADVVLVDGWKNLLWEELTSTGLLVAHGNELRFLHQSFAEFLAAQAHAEMVGAEFADLDSWVRRSYKESQKTFAQFTFTLWAARPGHDSTMLTDRLLAVRDPRRILLAGALMAEGITVTPETSSLVISRLVSMARNSLDIDDAIPAFETLGTLFDYPQAAENLDDLSRSPVLDTEWRAAAVAAFEHVHGGTRARELLLDLLPSAYGSELRKLLPATKRLGSTVVEAVRQRILKMTVEEDADSVDRAAGAALLHELNLADDVAAIAESVLADRYAGPNDLKRAAGAWIGAQGDSALPAIARLALARPENNDEGRADLAEVLFREGDRDTAVKLAKEILDRDALSMERNAVGGSAVRSAVNTLLSAQGAAAVADALAAVDRWSAPPRLETLWFMTMLLKRVIEVDPEIAVVPKLRPFLEEGNLIFIIGAYNLIDTWIAAEGISAVGSIMELIDGGRCLGEYDRAQCAEVFLAAGATSQAIALADLSLRSMSSARAHIGQAARVLIKADRPSAVERITALTQCRPAPPTEWYAGIMDILEPDSEPEVEQLAITCARQLVESASTGDELNDALGVLLRLADSYDLQLLAQTAWSDPRLSIRHRRAIAAALAATGELDLAKSVWRHLLTWQEYAWTKDVAMVRDLLAADVGSWAVDQLQEQLAAPATPALRRMRLRQMIAEISLADLNAADCGVT
jgi:NACHT domain